MKNKVCPAERLVERRDISVLALTPNLTTKSLYDFSFYI
jgi:hypothetical protein